MHVIKTDFKKITEGKTHRFLFEVAGDALGERIMVPVVAMRGHRPGPTIGITAAVHGNEINGVRVIQRIFKELNASTLRGTLVGVPVVNVPAFLHGTRNFDNRTDLNHVMPGKANGNRTEIYAHRVFSRIITQFDYLIDLHTASFGRINSYYVRVDVQQKELLRMAELLNPEIILHSKSMPGTLRNAASALGIKTITAELRDPYKFQKKMIKEAVTGVQNILTHLKMQPGTIVAPSVAPHICSGSTWMYTDQGGLLTVVPSILNTVKKGEVVARIRNVFGDVLKVHKAIANGIVIGKSINPVNQTGSRILHLGMFGQ